MAAVPPHVQRTWLGAVLEASLQQCAFDVGSGEASRIGVTTRGLVGELTHQTRAVRPSGAMTTKNIRSALLLLNKGDERCRYGFDEHP